MLRLLSTLAGAATIFVSTNIDDLLVVAAFFAEPRPHGPTIVAGQFLGIGALVFASAFVALATLTLPGTLFPYLGLIPLSLGLHRLWRAWQTARFRRTSPAPADHDRLPGRTSSSLLAVTIVTIANGSDNLTVYVPFFAKTPREIPIYAATFALLTAAWCFFGYLLVNHSTVGRQVHRLGHLIMPVTMILIGVWLLADALR